MIHAKEIGGIVFLLDGCQPQKIGAERGVDDIVVFKQLGRAQIARIIDIQLERLRSMLAERGIDLELEDSARELLSQEGYDPVYGARPLKRAIQRWIENPLAQLILSGHFMPGDTATGAVENDEIVFN